MSYKKIDRGHPDYVRLTMTRATGGWMCDAIDHNEDSGCSNPGCFKWNKAPACGCGGTNTFHGHTDQCAHGKWLLTLAWYPGIMMKMDDAFSKIFGK